MSRRGIIFGGTAGVGGAIAAHRTRIGDEVVSASRNATDGPSSIRCDIRNLEDVERAIARCEAEKPLSYVVNCVGIGYYAPFDMRASTQWQEILETNVLGLMHQISSVRRLSNELTHFVHVSSMAAHRSSETPGNECYAASKVAARILIEQFAQQSRLAGGRIRVSMVSPGFVRNTRFADHFFDASEESRFDLYEQHPSMEPEDVAKIVGVVLDNSELDVIDVLFQPARA